MLYWTQTIFGRHSGPARPGLLTRLADLLLTWQERATQRYRLAELDQAALKDIGLSRADVMHETAKPFWIA